MPINIVSHCAADIGIPADVVRRIAAGAPKMYKRFSIPKRGGRGFRFVAQPAREVKALQRSLVKFLSSHLEIHSAATAYVKGASVAGNARAHRGAHFMLKLDFENFFESISLADVKSMLLRCFGDNASEAEIDLISRSLTWRNQSGGVSLCIGAPSSPFVSNAIMFDFDSAVSSLCQERGAIYTRYSDDMTISAESRCTLLEIEENIHVIVRNSAAPSLRLNEAKRVLVGRASKMRVTGAYLSTQGDVTVGRLRKRGIRSGVNKFLRQELDAVALAKLKGEIAFSCDIEPEFADLLRRCYGEGINLIVPKRRRGV